MKKFLKLKKGLDTRESNIRKSENNFEIKVDRSAEKTEVDTNFSSSSSSTLDLRTESQTDKEYQKPFFRALWKSKSKLKTRYEPNSSLESLEYQNENTAPTFSVKNSEPRTSLKSISENHSMDTRESTGNNSVDSVKDENELYLQLQALQKTADKSLATKHKTRFRCIQADSLKTPYPSEAVISEGGCNLTTLSSCSSMQRDSRSKLDSLNQKSKRKLRKRVKKNVSKSSCSSAKIVCSKKKQLNRLKKSYSDKNKGNGISKNTSLFNFQFTQDNFKSPSNQKPQQTNREDPIKPLEPKPTLWVDSLTEDEIENITPKIKRTSSTQSLPKNINTINKESPSPVERSPSLFNSVNQNSVNNYSSQSAEDKKSSPKIVPYISSKRKRLSPRKGLGGSNEKLLLLLAGKQVQVVDQLGKNWLQQTQRTNEALLKITEALEEISFNRKDLQQVHVLLSSIVPEVMHIKNKLSMSEIKESYFEQYKEELAQIKNQISNLTVNKKNKSVDQSSSAKQNLLEKNACPGDIALKRHQTVFNCSKETQVTDQCTERELQLRQCLKKALSEIRDLRHRLNKREKGNDGIQMRQKWNKYKKLEMRTNTTADISTSEELLRDSRSQENSPKNHKECFENNDMLVCLYTEVFESLPESPRSHLLRNQETPEKDNAPNQSMNKVNQEHTINNFRHTLVHPLSSNSVFEYTGNCSNNESKAENCHLNHTPIEPKGIWKPCQSAVLANQERINDCCEIHEPEPLQHAKNEANDQDQEKYLFVKNNRGVQVQFCRKCGKPKKEVPDSLS